MAKKETDEFKKAKERARKRLLQHEALVYAADELACDYTADRVEQQAIIQGFLFCHFMTQIGVSLDSIDGHFCNTYKLLQARRL